MRKIKHLRWYICGLLFVATVFNYIDRQVFSILAPELQRDIGWSELAYGRIVIAFQVAYAASLLLSGGFIDRVGAKAGYAAAVVWWSIAEMAHAFARTPFGFGVARLFLGIGEAANFPTAIKAISEWFPRRESGLAAGIFNAAPTVGAILAPVLVPLTAALLGWRGAFIGTGVLTMLWLPAWLLLYHHPGKHPRIRFEDLRQLDHVHSKKEGAARISWKQLVGLRQTWAYAAGKILADPAWFFYLYWLPKFLDKEHGLRGTAVIPFLTTVYILCGIGSALGGLFSSLLIERGWSLNASRKLAMAASAGAMPVVVLAGRAHDPWTAVLFIGLALAAHQSWSSLTFTIGADMFPSRAVASVTGFAGACGSVATIVFSEITGRVLQHDPNAYFPMFVACGTMYLVALAIIHLLVPKLERAEI